jgi:hypothetical protein
MAYIFPRVRLAASVDLAKPAAPDDSVHGEVGHAQLNVELEVLPLTEPGELVAVDELTKDVAAQVGENFLHIGLEQRLGNFAVRLGQKALNVLR